MGVAANARKSSTVRRLIALLRYLAEDARPVMRLPFLADHFGVSTRTMRRDLAACEAEGVRVPRWRVR